MKSYLKLVNFEFNRFFKLYATLIVITVVSQLTGVFVLTKKYLDNAKMVIREESISQAAFIEDYGTFSFSDVTHSFWFSVPIALSVVGLLIYALFIWYRDWLGKNTFIYRLLTLPTERINIYFSKATAIFLMVLGLVSVQLILLLVENRLVKLLVPLDFRTDMSIAEITGPFSYLVILFPSSFFEFLIHYGIGFMVVFVLFTAILFERSFRIKGIFMGVLYLILSIGLFISPMIAIGIMRKVFLYPVELFILQLILWFVVVCASILVSRYLLNKKITI